VPRSSSAESRSPSSPLRRRRVRTRGIYAWSVKRPLPIALGWKLPSWVLDYGPVALIALESAVAIHVRPHPSGVAPGLLWLGLAANVAALLVRHHVPLLTLSVVLAVAVGLDYGPIVMLPTLLAVFTVAEYRGRPTVVAAAAVAVIALIVAQPVHSYHEALAAVLSRMIAVGLAVALGLYLRARADYVSGLHERAEQADRERELLAVKAVGDERVRIARELHDVVAHNVSLMVVQAQALAATASGEEDQRAALERLAGLGREALSEMHRMLGVLRLDDGTGAEREPQPGVRDLETLIGRTGQAGIDARLTVRGEARELPPAVDLSGYRIVQEALTNVIRHAEAQHVDVTLTYSPSELHVSVVDDGSGSTAALSNGSSDGHGLVGMRERAALFGGRLEAGARDDGPGYRVDASLPTG
jgi:signal transduction histidine kinase